MRIEVTEGMRTRVLIGPHQHEEGIVSITMMDGDVRDRRVLIVVGGGTPGSEPRFMLHMTSQETQVLADMLQNMVRRCCGLSVPEARVLTKGTSDE